MFTRAIPLVFLIGLVVVPFILATIIYLFIKGGTFIRLFLGILLIFLLLVSPLLFYFRTVPNAVHTSVTTAYPGSDIHHDRIPLTALSCPGPAPGDHSPRPVIPLSVSILSKTQFRFCGPSWGVILTSVTFISGCLLLTFVQESS